MQMSMKKKIAAISLSACMALGLTSCGLFGEPMHVIECIPQCSFEIPKSLDDGLVSYEDFLTAVGSGEYSSVESMAGIKAEYNNLYSVTAYNGGLVVSAYDLNSSMDLTTINDSNIKDMVIDLLGETTIIMDDGEYWGVDTSSEFYKNLEYDMDSAALTQDDKMQRLQVHLTSFSTYDNYEREEADGFTTEKLDYEGYVVFLTPHGKSTKMLLTATYEDNSLVSIKNIADSFVYNASVKGSDEAFSKETVDKISQLYETVSPVED